MAKYVNNNGVNEMWLNIKNWVTSQLLGYSQTGHTHSASEIISGLSNVATSGSYNDLSNKPTIPSKTSDLTNDSGYITSSGSCNYANSAGYASSAGSAGEVNTSVAAGSTKNLVYASMSNNDQCRIMCGGADNAGYMEIATSDDGNEPIYVRQYNNGIFGSIVRTLTLLDESGNTQFPGTVTAPTFSGNLNGNCSGTAGSVAWDNVSGKPSAFTPYFANGTWYAVGDDAAIGDHNVGGGLGVKALNSTTTRIDLCYKDDASNYKSITYDGTTLYMNGNCDYATSSGYTNWLRTSSHADHLLHTEWDGSYFWTYVAAPDSGYRAVRVERANSAGWADTSGRVRTQSNSDWYMNCNWDGSYFQTNCISDGGSQLPINVQKANYADSAGSVAWGNVSGRPWALSQFTNDSGFITSQQDLSGYVPRSGGVVMTGDTLARTVNNDYFTVCGCTDTNNGASIRMYGEDYSNSQFAGAVVIRTRGYSGAKELILTPKGTFTWNGNSIITTSDQRLKQQITEIDDKLLDAWEDVNLVQFKYNDAVDTKKDKARLHTGYVVQQIDDACKSHGVDVSKYGLYCHEVYQEETREVEQADGTKTTEVVRPANEHYSLRYTEALIVECAYLRKCIKELRTEIEQLKSSK